MKAKNSGKSKAIGLPVGVRRGKAGDELAPRSIRRRIGKSFLKECTKEELTKYAKIS